MSKEVENKKNNTKQQIIFGMFEMMMEKPYADITVKEICEKAEVSRMTFYRNFHTKEDVIFGQFEMVYSTFIKQLVIQNRFTFYDVATTFFTTIKENQLMMEAIVKNDLSNFLLNALRRYIKTLVDNQILKTREKSSEMLVAMISGGLTEVIITWTRDGMEQPIDELVIFASKYMHFKTN
ncbi:TetR/AcrR family transcriptional regulator [Fructilactobacillus frigidiflavus]|uniref:TetR/AcrR family transcriptional regulator n=1 Tax=Fructilactobacillus frigidiflavus TaxID=3242688 RepID=UPI003757FC76